MGNRPERLDRSEVATRSARVQRTLAQFYAALLLELVARYDEAKDERPSVLAKLRTEWHNISNSQEWSIHHAPNDPVAEELLGLLRGVTSSALKLVLGPIQRIKWLEELLPETQDTDDEKVLVLLGNLANAYADIDQASKAIDLLRSLLSAAEGNGFGKIEMTALAQLGNLYANQSELDKAVQFYRRSLVSLRDTDNKLAEASILNNIGHIHRRKSEYREAQDAFQQAHDTFEAMGERVHQAITLGGLATIARSIGEPERALMLQTERLVIFRELGVRNLDEAKALSGLGLAQYDLELYDDAEQSFLSALRITRELGARASEAMDLGNLGLVYAARGAFEQAYDASVQQFEVAHELGDKLTESNALGSMGTAAKNMGRLAVAMQFKQKQLDLSRKIGNQRGQASAHGGLSMILLELEDYDRAWSHHLLSLQIFQDIGDVAGEGRQLINGAQIEITRGNLEEALACLDEAEAVLPTSCRKERDELTQLRRSIQAA
ncbi:MAG: tetratricopeptide repeat protein [Pseudomonadota bacterium]